MKLITILLLLLFSSQINAQKFSHVETTTIDSFAMTTKEYVTDIRFKLDSENKELIIIEDGESTTIKFDLIHEKRNGTYLLTIGKPDYFIINYNSVLHHQEIFLDKIGSVIIRNLYKSNLIKI
jgi:hypothetical protein